MEKPIKIEVDQQDKSPRTKRRLQFNALISKINSLKQQLEHLNEQIKTGTVFYHAEIMPLHQKQHVLMAAEARALHHCYDHPIFSKKDREKIAHLIVVHCRYLFQVESQTFDDLTAIHDFYADETREELEKEQKQANKEAQEEILRSFDLDIELEDDDDFEQMREKAQAQAERKRYEDAQRRKAAADNTKSEKQKLKEERERQRGKDTHKVSKNIYSDLVKLLHPDLESDEAKRAIKTEIIQRVNAAYEGKDFFALLSLQAEYLNRQGDDLAQMPEKEFKRYLKVLETQEQELLMGLDTNRRATGFEAYIRTNLCHQNHTTMLMLRQKAVSEEKKAIKVHQYNLSLAKNAKTLKEALPFYDINE